ncbi:nuclear transcription factor Y subunit A-2 [Coffea arabica]|uniref:Nuclear transcription factor Y subunit n=1 Tax=Coffea arabica TaxID=13443 RepID=A0A6P6SHX8_COFAR
MAMHGGLFAKEANTTSAFSAVPWWSTGLGSQPAGFHDDLFGQFKPASSAVDKPSNTGTQLTPSREPERNGGQETGNGKTNKFTIFSGECKDPPNGQKFRLQNASNMQAAAAEYRGHLELGFSQPLICAKYPYGEQCHGVFSTYGPQLTGRIMLPLNSTSDEVPIFVNVKQYNGILRRRQYRAKAELENKVLKNRKPYLHLSRHLHAMRRPRGCGGRFLNTKNLNGSKSNTDDNTTAKGRFSRPTGSQSSDVVQSDSGNSSSLRKANGCRSNNLGTEVTSVYSGGDLDCFPFNNLSSAIQSLPNMMTSGHWIVPPGKWVVAADSCCNLKV